MKRGLLITLVIFVVWFVTHTIVISIDGLTANPTTADCILILGNKVNPDGTLSPRLVSRVEKGLDLYKQNLAAKIIVSGGFGKEKQFEGTAMKKYLMRKGVPDQNIIIDNEGSNTTATARNFVTIASRNNFSSVIVVSQFYHITRTKYILKSMGVTNISASSADYFEVRDLYSLVREFFAYYQYLLIRK